jgi:small GTP-binding protein
MEEARSIDSKGPLKMKVCFVGDYAVGKTSIAERFVHDRFRSAYVPTIGTQIMKKQFTLATSGSRGNVKIDMVIWDIMGQKGFRELLNEAYFHGTRAVLAVCDVTRDETLKNLEYWIDSVFNVTGTIPVRILGNKWDLSHQRRIQETDVAALAKKYDTGYDLTSAKTGRDVEKAFYALAERYLVEKFSKGGSYEAEDSADAVSDYSSRASPAEEVS